jgi:hypothetical protein
MASTAIPDWAFSLRLWSIMVWLRKRLNGVALFSTPPTALTAYSGEADHDSGLMAIMIPGSCRSPSERSDAGSFHDRSMIGISQSFLF